MKEEEEEESESGEEELSDREEKEREDRERQAEEEAERQRKKAEQEREEDVRKKNEEMLNKNFMQKRGSRLRKASSDIRLLEERPTMEDEDYVTATGTLRRRLIKRTPSVAVINETETAKVTLKNYDISKTTLPTVVIAMPRALYEFCMQMCCDKINSPFSIRFSC